MILVVYHAALSLSEVPELELFPFGSTTWKVHEDNAIPATVVASKVPANPVVKRAIFFVLVSIKCPYLKLTLFNACQDMLNIIVACLQNNQIIFCIF